MSPTDYLKDDPQPLDDRIYCDCGHTYDDCHCTEPEPERCEKCNQRFEQDEDGVMVCFACEGIKRPPEPSKAEFCALISSILYAGEPPPRQKRLAKILAREPGDKGYFPPARVAGEEARQS